ncbi:MAG: GlsB/YeaQ/YmgE family stress response membrane protein [Actinomycetota bacterium]|nr:GlsB/YeaQ/YmgE family stress response membrane protein [Actinomycetota bacterium]
MLLALLVLCLVFFVVLPVLGATVWALLTTLLVGLVLGAFARLIAPGSGSMGCLTTSLVGVFGSLLGTAAARALDTGSFVRLLLQVASAVVLVMVIRPTRGVRS